MKGFNDFGYRSGPSWESDLFSRVSRWPLNRTEKVHLSSVNLLLW